MDTVITQVNSQSLFAIIYQGDWLSLLVLMVLLIMSVVSWAVILRKWIFLSGLSSGAKRFLKKVDLTNGLSDIILRSEQRPDSYTARLFHAAYAAYNEHINRGSGSQGVVDKKLFLQSVERQIDKAIIVEKAMMERELGLLATISSSAPFIGLLLRVYQPLSLRRQSDCLPRFQL